MIQNTDTSHDGNGSGTERSQIQNSQTGILSLKNNTTDYVFSWLKAIVGIVPGGTLVVEPMSTIIPNQRIDRIAKFIEVLSHKLSKLSVRTQLTNENFTDFTDFLEESLVQAIRSITQERREYIASLIANGISLDNIDYIESKHLLKLLGELNDIEVIWLRSHLVSTIGRDEEFMEKHQAVLQPINAHLGSSPEELDKHTLRQSYKEHLVQLGLLIRKYKVDKKTKQLELDNNGQFQISGYEITSLGRLLLKYVGLTPDGYQPSRDA
jgi:hypothetical protein